MGLQAIVPVPDRTSTSVDGRGLLAAAMPAAAIAAGSAAAADVATATPLSRVAAPPPGVVPGASGRGVPRRGLAAFGSGLLLAGGALVAGARAAAAADLPAGAALLATDGRGEPRPVRLGANLSMADGVLTASGTLQADLSTASVLATGTRVPERLGDALAQVMRPEMFGARGDCVIAPDGTVQSGTDDGPALQACIDALGPRGGQVHLGPKNYLVRTTVVIRDAAIFLVGTGYAERPGPVGGTWIVQDRVPEGSHVFRIGDILSAATPAGFRPSEAARGTSIRDMAFYQVQPVPGPGWQPTDYPHVIGAHNLPGGVRLDNLFFCGITRGILLDNVGHPELGTLKGQWYSNALTVTNCQDTPSLRWLRHWGYREASDHDVQVWQRANLDLLLLGRVDGIMIDNLFGFGCRSVVHCFQEPAVTGSANPAMNRDGGVAQGFILNLQSDHCSWPLWLDHLDNHGYPIIWNVSEFCGDCVGTVTADGGNAPSPQGNYAIWVDGCRDHVDLAVTSFFGEYFFGEAVRISGTTNTVRFGTFTATQTNLGNASPAPAVVVVEDNTALVTGPQARGTPNEVAFGAPPRLTNAHGCALVDAQGNAVTSATAFYVDGVVQPQVSAPVRLPSYAIGALPDPVRYAGQQVELHGLREPSRYGPLAYANGALRRWCWLGTDIAVSELHSPAELAFLEVGVSGGRQRIGAALARLSLPEVTSDLGGNWHAAGSAYVARWAGVYRVTTRMRLAAGTPGGVAYGQTAGRSAGDEVALLWFVTAPERQARRARESSLNTRELRLAAGETVMMLACVDDPTATLVVEGAQMTVSLVARG